MISDEDLPYRVPQPPAPGVMQRLDLLERQFQRLRQSILLSVLGVVGLVLFLLGTSPGTRTIEVLLWFVLQCRE